MMAARGSFGLVLALALSNQAHALPSPLCQRPEVLQEVGRTVRQWNNYNAIDETTVQEAPTEYANAVVCHAVLVTVTYVETTRGWVRQPFRELRRYDVQVRGNRFFVQVAP